jgi:hypothetical protein
MTLHIHRDTPWFGRIVAITILVDGKKAGGVFHGNTFMAGLPDRAVVVQARHWWWRSNRLTIEPLGNDVFIELSMREVVSAQDFVKMTLAFFYPNSNWLKLRLDGLST